MSSIFGKIHKSNGPVEASDLERMQTTLNYWNADNTGIWINGNAALGHLMLYNTPESLTETLPYYDSECAMAITSDARLDNRDELYTLLHINTPSEKQIPDSILILRLYRKYGKEFIHHLIGDFAFAIYDKHNQQIFCARDHMGVKPFFYSLSNAAFAFASEKKGLLCLPETDSTIDKRFLYNQVLEPSQQDAVSTLYNGIHRLAPAHTLTYSCAHHTLSLQRYWTLDVSKELKLSNTNEYYEGLRTHFEQAVRCRLRSHYRIGAELSGGMDSSSITGVASSFLKESRRSLTTFSNIDNGNAITGDNETHYIEEVNRFNSIEDYVFVKENIWADPIDEVAYGLKVNDGLEKHKLYWQLAIKKAAYDRDVRTLLSGFPGDEMVTYRGQFYLLDYLDRHRYLDYFRAKTEKKFGKLKPFISPNVEYLLHKLKNVRQLNDPATRTIAALVNMPVKYRLQKDDLLWSDNTYRDRYKSYRHYQAHRLLKPHVALRMETETRFGIGFRTESRFPMADIRLTQFYLSVPNDIKYSENISRYAFRTAMSRYLPQSVLTRDSKAGNIAPFRDDISLKRRQEEALQSMLTDYKERHRKSVQFILPKQKNNLLKYIELLLWIKKNFEGL